MRQTDGHLSGKYSSRWSEPQRSVRTLAAEVVTQVQQGASLDTALPAAQAALVQPQDRALLQSICYGVLRDLRLLQTLVSRLLDRPLKPGDIKLQSLLLVGLQQLRSMRIPEHAAVSETVDAARQIGRESARGMINAVLRRYQREKTSLEETLITAEPAIRKSHPDWLVTRLRRDWPLNWQDILVANNTPGPLSLRVNLARIARDEYLQRLQEAGLDGAISAVSDAGIVMRLAVPVERLPGFADGLVSVQDVAAQLAAPLLKLEPGCRVLDACAAPGGKTAHILETEPRAELLALDRDEQRLARVAQGLERLHLQASLLTADAAETRAWWDGRPFDRILLDAPCSGTGVIRRHPDIKWLRRDTDIATLAAQQRRLLDALWPLLAPSGLLLYASCSVLADEGAALMTAFTAAQPQAREQPIEAEWGEPCNIGRRIRPGQDGMDGFYYARLQKKQ